MDKLGGNKDSNHIEEQEMLRYLNGEMSDEERHAFEKRLEKDPFAYEAVEGFENADKKAIPKDLAQMRAEKQPWKSRPPLVLRRIAAGVALMIMATITVLWLTVDESEPVAQRGDLPADSAAIALQQEEEEEVPEQGTESPTPVIAEPATSDPASESEQTTQPPAEATGPAGDASPVEEIVAADELEERISFEADEAQKEAGDDYYVQEEVIVEGIREGEFEEQLETKPEAQKKVLDEAITDRGDAGSALSTAEGVSSKSRKAGGVARSVSAAENAPVELAAPDMGWEAFNKHVRNNQRKSADMSRGQVGLLFTLDGEGNPAQIEVVKSLCDPCDQEAIRLLTNSGKWSYYNHVSGSPKTAVNISIRK